MAEIPNDFYKSLEKDLQEFCDVSNRISATFTEKLQDLYLKIWEKDYAVRSKETKLQQTLERLYRNRTFKASEKSEIRKIMDDDPTYLPHAPKPFLQPPVKLNLTPENFGFHNPDQVAFTRKVNKPKGVKRKSSKLPHQNEESSKKSRNLCREIQETCLDKKNADVSNMQNSKPQRSTSIKPVYRTCESSVTPNEMAEDVAASYQDFSNTCRAMNGLIGQSTSALAQLNTFSAQLTAAESFNFTSQANPNEIENIATVSSMQCDDGLTGQTETAASSTTLLTNTSDNINSFGVEGSSDKFDDLVVTPHLNSKIIKCSTSEIQPEGDKMPPKLNDTLQNDGEKNASCIQSENPEDINPKNAVGDNRSDGIAEPTKLLGHGTGKPTETINLENIIVPPTETERNKEIENHGNQTNFSPVTPSSQEENEATSLMNEHSNVVANYVPPQTSTIESVGGLSQNVYQVLVLTSEQLLNLTGGINMQSTQGKETDNQDLDRLLYSFTEGQMFNLSNTNDLEINVSNEEIHDPISHITQEEREQITNDPVLPQNSNPGSPNQFDFSDP